MCFLLKFLGIYINKRNTSSSKIWVNLLQKFYSPVSFTPVIGLCHACNLRCLWVVCIEYDVFIYYLILVIGRIVVLLMKFFVIYLFSQYTC